MTGFCKWRRVDKEPSEMQIGANYYICLGADEKQVWIIRFYSNLNLRKAKLLEERPKKKKSVINFYSNNINSKKRNK